MLPKHQKAVAETQREFVLEPTPWETLVALAKLGKIQEIYYFLDALDETQLIHFLNDKRGQLQAAFPNEITRELFKNNLTYHIHDKSKQDCINELLFEPATLSTYLWQFWQQWHRCEQAPTQQYDDHVPLLRKK